MSRHHCMPHLTALALAASLALPAGAEMISVNYLDNQGSGFFDSSSVDPLPGNPGTTLGEQRRIALDKAIDAWASRLDSNIRLRLNVEFDDLGCGDRTTLAQAGTNYISVNFDNRPETNAVFPGTMATALSGEAPDDFDAEMRAQFNLRLDQGDCLDGVSGFWYGLDAAIMPSGGTISFLEVATHELGHGLGFQSLTDEDREFFFFEQFDERLPDRMSRFIRDLGEDKTWRELSAEERVESSTSGSELVFTGERTNLRAAERLLPPSRIRIPGNPPINAFIQGLPPYLSLAGLDAPMVLAQGPGPGPGSESPWHRALACQPLDNSDEADGAIVLAKRGECSFATKWQNAFDAGAAALVIADDRVASANPDSNIARDNSMNLDRQLPIPLWSVSQGRGDQLVSNVPAASARLEYQTFGARGTRQGFVNLQASTENTGSNVSHFAESMFPPSLMNPSHTGLAFDGGLDFTPDFMLDLGWIDNAAKLDQYTGAWFNPGRDGEGCQLTVQAGQSTPILTCYLYRDGEQLWLIGTGEYNGDHFAFDEMTVTEGTGFGADFDAAEVERSNWGSARMDVLDCNTGRLSLDPQGQGLEPFITTIEKIVPADCNRRASEQLDRSRTATYFDPARDGEGIQLSIEGDGQSWFLSFYTYLDGDQAWLVGTGSRLGSRVEFDEVILTRGADYGQAFDPADVERIDFGQLEIHFEDCNNITVEIDSIRPEFESGQRQMRKLVEDPAC